MFLKNILTSFQLENCDNLRFLKFIYTHPSYWFMGGERQKIVRTKKAILICLLGIIISTGFLVLALRLVQIGLDGNRTMLCIVAIAGFSVWLGLIPIFLVISNILLFPLDKYLKHQIIKNAHKKLVNLKKSGKLKVIGITGSYGKTTQKEILAKILEGSFKIITSDKNKNTPLGISETILNDLSEKHEIFIVEMGAYKKGEIKEICELVNPDIGILTGITLQHLERFKTLENIIDAKFEIIESLDENGLAILDFSNKNISDGFAKKKDNFKVKNFVKVYCPENVKYLENLGGISFQYDNLEFQTKLLASHNANQIISAYEVAKNLGIQSDKILKQVKKIGYVKHRLELIYNSKSQLYVIDDSFNGNIEGVNSTIKLLENITDKRKLYLTPGLVELGNKSDEVHLEIGKKIAKVIDKALLIKNNSTKKIGEGLLKVGFDENNILWYDTTNLAHDDIKNQVQKNDVIVFQNDWTDNYF